MDTKRAMSDTIRLMMMLQSIYDGTRITPESLAAQEIREIVERLHVAGLVPWKIVEATWENNWDSAYYLLRQVGVEAARNS